MCDGLEKESGWRNINIWGKAQQGSVSDGGGCSNKLLAAVEWNIIEHYIMT